MEPNFGEKKIVQIKIAKTYERQINLKKLHDPVNHLYNDLKVTSATER